METGRRLGSAAGKGSDAKLNHAVPTSESRIYCIRQLTGEQDGCRRQTGDEEIACGLLVWYSCLDKAHSTYHVVD